MWQDVLFVSPTFLPITVNLLLQTIVWAWVVSFKTGYGLGYVKHFLRRHFPQLYKRCGAHELNTNHARLVSAGMDKDPGLFLVWNIGTIFHHFVGGTLMGLGYFWKMPWLWRHGMLVEVGGLDLRDTLDVLQCRLLPVRGRFPTRNRVKSNFDFGLALFHHTVGLGAGLVVTVYFSEVPEFQWFGVVALGLAGIPILLNLIAGGLPEGYGRTRGLLRMCALLEFVRQRFVYMVPATYRLSSIVLMDSKVGVFGKGLLLWSGVAMSMFNCLMLGVVLSRTLSRVVGGGGGSEEGDHDAGKKRQ